MSKHVATERSLGPGSHTTSIAFDTHDLHGDRTAELHWQLRPMQLTTDTALSVAKRFIFFFSALSYIVHFADVEGVLQSRAKAAKLKPPIRRYWTCPISCMSFTMCETTQSTVMLSFLWVFVCSDNMVQ